MYRYRYSKKVLGILAIGAYQYNIHDPDCQIRVRHIQTNLTRRYRYLQPTEISPLYINETHQYQ